jgi:hypothetical protein
MLTLVRSYATQLLRRQSSQPLCRLLDRDLDATRHRHFTIWLRPRVRSTRCFPSVRHSPPFAAMRGEHNSHRLCRTPCRRRTCSQTRVRSTSSGVRRWVERNERKEVLVPGSKFPVNGVHPERETWNRELGPVRRQRAADAADDACRSATARLTVGATCVPSNSIARITLSCGVGPTVSWMRKR